jgi:hypothetical protein
MNPLHLIIFLFIGHSNMQGYCAQMDTVADPHVWAYQPGCGFFNPTDRNFQSGSGSPILPFLKRMARMYPGYNFCGVQHASPCQQAFHLYTEQRHRECLINQINVLKGKGTFGGVLLMHGIVEQGYKSSIDSFELSIISLVNFLRHQTDDAFLPVILGKFEENGDHKTAPQFYKYQEEIIKKINKLPKLIGNLSLTPYKPIPKELFCDDHHYNAEGYRIWSWDAVTIYKYNGYDTWARK